MLHRFQELLVRFLSIVKGLYRMCNQGWVRMQILGHLAWKTHSTVVVVLEQCLGGKLFQPPGKTSTDLFRCQCETARSIVSEQLESGRQSGLGYGKGGRGLV